MACDEEKWKIEQFELQKRVRVDRDLKGLAKDGELRLVAGMDLSFFKGDDTKAVACIAVLEFPSLQRVWHICRTVPLRNPYVPGYLGFREAPPLMEMWAEVSKAVERGEIEKLPQLIIVDGNGTIHPRRFGLACHLGVLLDIPTIGIAKKFMATDGFTRQSVAKRAETLSPGEYSILISPIDSYPLGAILRGSESKYPVFVSPGHAIDLNTAVQIVKRLFKYRIPEPTRQADLISRDVVAKYEAKILSAGTVTASTAALTTGNKSE